MTIDENNILESILKSISRIDYLKPEDLPNIALYMDQVTSLMDKEMKSLKRFDDDKILTKTMINNYAKNNLLPPPIRKKYEKEHILMLVFIFYFKNVLSIKDIEKLLSPIADKHFNNDSDADLNISDIYSQVLTLQKTLTENLTEDIRTSYDKAQETFASSDVEDKESLQLFAFICSLSVDIFVRKQIIEELIDTIFTNKDTE